MNESRLLRVFLCHSSNDKPIVRDVYKLLAKEKWIIPWLDEVILRPGQDWKFEIENAINETDVVIVFLSRSSVSKEGFVQKEIRNVLDKFDEKPAGTIYIIPIRVEECEVPKRLADLQWVDISINNAEWYSPLLESLKLKAKDLSIPFDQADEDKDLLSDKYGRLLSDFELLDLELNKTKRVLEIREIEVRAILSQAHTLANTDVLTYLQNRRKIAVDLQEEVIRSNRYGTMLSIIYFDLDNFKNINDTYGHAVGDKALSDFGAEVGKIVLHPNSIGRYGGEEFLAVLPNSELKIAIELAASLCQHIRNTPITIDEHIFQLTISLGVVQYKIGEENWEQFLLRADQALYDAKNNGGDQWSAIET
jgi:diguanylate cyclase (GGDEF)-like protein